MSRLAALVALAGAACGPGSACGGGGSASADASPGPEADGGTVTTDAGLGPRATIHFVGRFDRADEAGPRFDWSGTTITTRFDGSELQVELDDGGQNQFSVWVDGVLQPVLKTQPGVHAYTLASGLPAGEHDLVLSRRTEAFFGSTQFRGFSGAPLVETPARTRFIELVGDSITCGYGVLGDGATCPFSADTESEPDAYGALAAAELGAAHTAIAWSGKGVHRNYGGAAGELVPELYERTRATDAASAWTFDAYHPDAIVVNLGTNDFSDGDPGAGFFAAYDAFVVTLRARHPDAWIVVALSPMLSDSYPPGAMHRSKARAYLEQVVAAAAGRGDLKLAVLELAEQLEADGLGCDYHPGRTTHQKMAQALAARLRTLLAW